MISSTILTVLVTVVAFGAGVNGFHECSNPADNGTRISPDGLCVWLCAQPLCSTLNGNEQQRPSHPRFPQSSTPFPGGNQGESCQPKCQSRLRSQDKCDSQALLRVMVGICPNMPLLHVCLAGCGCCASNPSASDCMQSCIRENGGVQALASLPDLTSLGFGSALSQAQGLIGGNQGGLPGSGSPAQGLSGASGLPGNGNPSQNLPGAGGLGQTLRGSGNNGQNGAGSGNPDQNIPNAGTPGQNFPNIGSASQNLPNVGNAGQNLPGGNPGQIIPNAGNPGQNSPNAGNPSSNFPDRSPSQNFPNNGNPSQNLPNGGNPSQNQPGTGNQGSPNLGSAANGGLNSGSWQSNQPISG